MARPREALASPGERGPRFGKVERAALAGHARLFIHPAYARLVATEPYAKRLIPLLIILFVGAIGLMRGIALNQEHQEAEASARQLLLLAAQSVAAELAENQPLSLVEPSEALQGQLENALPALAAAEGRVVMIMDPEGRIVATAPREPGWIGRHFREIASADELLLTLGERAGVLPVTLASGEDAIATVQHGSTGAGTIAALQPSVQILAEWRRTVSREAAVFVASAIVLVILGFAFHAEAARAQEADSIYSETQTRFHMALRRGHSGLWEWDLSRGAIFWSSSMFEILGLTPQNRLLSVSEVAELAHPDDIDLVATANALVKAGQGQMDEEFRMRHADGGWIWIRARAEVAPDVNDEPHLVGIAVDVTEQRRLAEASRTADLRLRDAIEAISEAFVLWDSGNRLVICNSKYQQLYEIPEELARAGISYEEIAARGRPPIVAGNMPAGEDGAHARSLEARVDDGRWLQINERRTKDGGFVSVGTDITALKQNEAQLIENERALRETVADLRRSRQQLEKQAQQLVELAEKYAVEKDKAEDSNRIKSEFLANVSHELRTPLNAIIGFSDMMLAGAFGPLGAEKYAEYCRDIRASGDFLLRVISDILEMARLEAGRIEIDREPLEMGSIVTETVEAYLQQAERNGVRLVAEAPPDLTLSADRQAVRQVLFNLVSNAVKFTPEGGVVRIRAGRRRNGVAIVVEDTGIGIPSSALAKLGRPFEQVQSPLTRSHKGSGLGLAIARSLVALHGGEMDILSKQGVGTKVSIYLPLRPSHSTQTAAA